MRRIIDIGRRSVNRVRRLLASRRERAFFDKILPAEQLQPIIQRNRNVLRQVPKWIDDDVYDRSIFQYGLPRDLRHLIDLEQGPEPTYADAIVALSQRLTRPVNYLEIGVSVGKTFWQVINGISNAHITGFDIEDISPVLRTKLEAKSTGSWSGPADSMRKMPSFDHQFFPTDNANQVRYLAADVFDPQAWERLAGERFNLIFSDAFHSPAALRHEFAMIHLHKLLDGEEFVLVWDDLSGDMRSAFEEIAADLRSRYGIPEANQFVMPLRGWLGEHWGMHPVGFLINTKGLPR